MPHRVEIRAARPAEYPAVLETVCAAFGEHLRPLMSAMLWGDPTLTVEDIRVAVVNGDIASVVRIADRPIHYGDATLRLAGIGAVCTHPDFRGQGLASLVLHDAARSMRERGYHLAMLFTGIQPFYARLGWTPVPHASFRLDLADMQKRGWNSPLPELGEGLGEGAVVVRPFDESRDLPTVMRIYDRFNRDACGPHLRSPDFWTSALSREYHIMPSFVAERAGDVVAYASTSAHGHGLTLAEAACAPGGEDAFRCLAGAIVSQARALGLRVIEGRMPPGHGLSASLQRLDGVLAQNVVHQSTMFLLLDLPRLLQAALPALAARQRPSNVLSLGLRVEGHRARLAMDGGNLRIDTGEAGRTTTLSADAFWRLFFGQCPVREGPPGLGADEDEVAVLDALFPPREFIYWWADHF